METECDDNEVIESEEDDIEFEPDLQAFIWDVEIEESSDEESNEEKSSDEEDPLDDNTLFSELANGRTAVYRSRNDTIWSKEAPPSTRTRVQNIRIRASSPRGEAAGNISSIS
ncbi:hypothetical protein EVAR_53917_1 [Eumeta japonica]|uniref:Uncharacterized protein n=1 Tax=Eumeta variegata TaxID=151549 RepID=A0A4C1YLG6_EUMVA|nr:hypothetical protein EVAR_53917_1 [Eumeta japonica]